jgi:hypothetical protein
VLPVLRCTIARVYIGGTGRIAVNFEGRLCCGSHEAWVVVPRVVRSAGALRYVQRVLAILLKMRNAVSRVSHTLRVLTVHLRLESISIDRCVFVSARIPTATIGEAQRGPRYL